MNLDVEFMKYWIGLKGAGAKPGESPEFYKRLDAFEHAASLFEPKLGRLEQENFELRQRLQLLLTQGK